MSDLVSVVVPVYNVERYLDKCIDSIVNQTYRNLEIILVDDGSPDSCPRMCEEWARKDERIRVVHKENQGLGMARNTGIENANGKYIFFFDSDDYVDTALVDKCVTNAAENDADLVWYSMTDVDEKGNVYRCDNGSSIKCYSDNEQVKSKLLPQLMSHDYRTGAPANFAFSAWSGMFSMDIIRKYALRFPSEREIISEDTYFLLQYFNYVESAVALSDILYFHFVNTSSLTTTYKADRQEKNNHFFTVTTELLHTLGYDKEIYYRLCMLYHSFSLAALKLIYSSSLSPKEKRATSNKLLKSLIIKESISREVLQREKNTVRLFFWLLSLGLFPLCNLLLKIKK